MPTRRPKARASDLAGGLDRRSFLAGAIGLLALPMAARGRAAELPTTARAALETSPFVYVSPLRADGSESTCHGEVWFGWLDGAVHLTTSRTTWKARALARGLDRARIWVGDHGRWKRLLGTNEAFRKAPSFDARASVVDDPAVVARLLELYADKYPAEFPSWKERMQQGHANATRLLLRYSSDVA